MDEWVAHIAASVGIAPAVARLAVGHVWLPPEAPSEWPCRRADRENFGAEAAIRDAASAPLRGLLGGVLGGVGGLVGGAKGDVLALTARLTSLGLSPDQLQKLARETFGGAEQVIGRDKLQSMTDSIPGLSQFLWPKS